MAPTPPGPVLARGEAKVIVVAQKENRAPRRRAVLIQVNIVDFVGLFLCESGGGQSKDEEAACCCVSGDECAFVDLWRVFILVYPAPESIEHRPLLVIQSLITTREAVLAICSSTTAVESSESVNLSTAALGPF